MSKEHVTPDNPDEVAKASDVEQETGHGGNLRDDGTTPAPTMPGFTGAVGNSAHVPRRGEIFPPSADEQTESPGADAERGAGLPSCNTADDRASRCAADHPTASRPGRARQAVASLGRR